MASGDGSPIQASSFSERIRDALGRTPAGNTSQRRSSNHVRSAGTSATARSTNPKPGSDVKATRASQPLRSTANGLPSSDVAQVLKSDGSWEPLPQRSPLMQRAIDEIQVLEAWEALAEELAALTDELDNSAPEAGGGTQDMSWAEYLIEIAKLLGVMRSPETGRETVRSMRQDAVGLLADAFQSTPEGQAMVQGLGLAITASAGLPPQVSNVLAEAVVLRADANLLFGSELAGDLLGGDPTKLRGLNGSQHLLGLVRDASKAADTIVGLATGSLDPTSLISGASISSMAKGLSAGRDLGISLGRPNQR